MYHFLFSEVPRVLLEIFLQGNGGAVLVGPGWGQKPGEGCPSLWQGRGLHLGCVMETHLQERQLIPSGAADGAGSQARGR